MTDLILDIYPFLSFKNADNTLSRISVSYSWVPEEFQRRLKAYTILAAYSANLANLVRNVEADDLHEYGDANFICTAMASAVLGDQVQIVAPESQEQEDFFSDWAKDEFFFTKMFANEYTASNLGDCVYRLSFSRNKGRVLVKEFDPGFWFPFNLGKSNERHILAWEEQNGDEIEIFKEEYSLQSPASGTGRSTAHLTAGWYEKKNRPGLDDLKLLRFATDADGNTLDNYDLGTDFIPIIYVPNIYRGGWDFGESDLTSVWRVLDELANCYSDQAVNAYLMGLAMLWVDPKIIQQLPIKDGKVTIPVGKNTVFPGHAGVVDNSNLNTALEKRQDKLEDKLFSNTFLGPLGSGRLHTGSGDRTTGIVQLKGSLFERYVNIKRLLREAKYNKLLKFVARMEALHNKNKLFTFRNQERLFARVQFGNILPVDQTAFVQNLERVKDRLGNRDMKDNLREAGITVNEDLKDAPTTNVTQPKT